MRPWMWHPPVELSSAEERVVKRVRRAKLFVFLRQQRAELFSDAFQQELAAVYKDSPLGQPPVPPAQLALAWLLHQGQDVLPIPGTRRAERVVENAKAADIRLTPELLNRINERARPGLAEGATLI